MTSIMAHSKANPTMTVFNFLIIATSSNGRPAVHAFSLDTSSDTAGMKEALASAISKVEADGSMDPLVGQYQNEHGQTGTFSVNTNSGPAVGGSGAQTRSWVGRPISFDQARNQYGHRFTADHIPAWAEKRLDVGKYYAPQYDSDAQWYERTLFNGEDEIADKNHCYSADESWPLGTFLPTPYTPVVRELYQRYKHMTAQPEMVAA